MNLELRQTTLEEADLRALLARAPVGMGDHFRLERHLVKQRADWRGTRLFERIVVSDGERTFDLLAKYCRPSTSREVHVYRDILHGRQLGTARFLGAVAPGDGSTTLVLEFVPGRRLKRCAETEVWSQVARWLGRVHRVFAGHAALAGLPAYDEEFYRTWAERALESASQVSPEAAEQVRRIVARYDEVAVPLAEAEPTLLHAEFYCTNILVQESPGGIRICPFDWETAAAGCGALDLAYLLRQKLGITDECLSEAYREGWREAGGSGPGLEPRALRAQVRRGRIHELMFSIWAEVHHKEALPERISRAAELAWSQLTSL
jgi:aminoglycoside phosphotransferase (APT) family kinase protein